MRNIAIADIMTRNFASVTPEESLCDCAKKMVRESVNSLLVVRKDKLIGILTSRDILRKIIKKSKINLKGIPCINIATKKIAVIKPSSDINQAVKKCIPQISEDFQ